MDRLLLRLLVVLSVAALLVWLAVLPGRALYPFELEWQEGGMLQHVERVTTLQPLYAEPTLEFMAFPYPPLFTWAAAVASVVFGVLSPDASPEVPTFLALRAVSIASTIATLALLFLYVSRDTGKRVAGVAAAGLYVASYSYTGAWLDVGRVDSLAMALTLAAIYAARFSEGRRGALIAGLLGALAFLTKQTSLAVVLVLVIPLWRRSRSNALAFLASLIVASAVPIGALHVASDGWSTWYLFGLLGGQTLLAEETLQFWTVDMVVLAPAFFAAFAGLPREEERPGRDTLACVVPVLVLVAWLGRGHQGGYVNTLLPAVLAASLVAGRVVGRATRRLRASTHGVYVLVAVQLALFAYDPRKTVPTEADAEAAVSVIERLRAIDGPVLAPQSSYLAERAGKRPTIHAMAVVDLTLSEGSQLRAYKLVQELEAALREGRYSAILLSDTERWEDLEGFQDNYELEERLFGPEDEGTFVPRSGAPVRPEWLYLRR